MIILQLNDWTPVEGLLQVATTWEIATDKEFTNILESTKSDTMLRVFQSDVVIPADQIVYVRAMRHFNDSTADYWTDARKMINNEESYSSMLLSTDIIVEQPIVDINLDEYFGVDPTFTITTSDFKCNNAEHYATHWIIKDGIGNIVFTSLEDTANKTSIAVTKTATIMSKTQFKLYAIHVAAGNIESKPGEFNVKLSSFNFEIVSDLTKVNGMEDYTLKLKKINDLSLIHI